MSGWRSTWAMMMWIGCWCWLAPAAEALVDVADRPRATGARRGPWQAGNAQPRARRARRAGSAPSTCRRGWSPWP